jgi:hypothetical protein
MAVQADQPTVRNQGRNVRRLWRVVTTLIAIILFLQAFFAGAMLSGFAWGHTPHKAAADILIVSTLTAGVAAIVTLRRIAHGPRLALILLSLTLLEVLQTTIGRLSAEGASLMWIHIPLGVALVGLASGSVSAARLLGDE